MTQRVWGDKDLDAYERVVMLALADCHNPKDGCFPSIETMVDKTQFSERALYNIVDRLIKKGRLKKTSGGGRGRRNDYLLYPELEFQFEPTSETLHPVQGLSEPETLHPTQINPASGVAKPCIPGKETLHPVQGLSLEKSLNGEAPNGKGTVIGTVKSADALFSLSDSAEDKPKPKRKAKREQKPFQAPALEDFISYGLSQSISEQDCRDLFKIWDAGVWKDGNGTPIHSWKQKLVKFQTHGYLPSQKRASRMPTGQEQQKRRGPCTM